MLISTYDPLEMNNSSFIQSISIRKLAVKWSFRYNKDYLKGCKYLCISFTHVDAFMWTLSLFYKVTIDQLILFCMDTLLALFGSFCSTSFSTLRSVCNIFFLWYLLMSGSVSLEKTFETFSKCFLEFNFFFSH